MMKADRINQEMARIDGYVWVAARSGCRFMSLDAKDVMAHGSCSDDMIVCHDWAFRGVPKYTEDLNAVVLVLGKLSDRQHAACRDDITELVHISSRQSFMHDMALRCCEVILKACGKWEDE